MTKEWRVRRADESGMIGLSIETLLNQLSREGWEIRFVLHDGRDLIVIASRDEPEEKTDG